MGDLSLHLYCSHPPGAGGAVFGLGSTLVARFDMHHCFEAQHMSGLSQLLGGSQHNKLAQKHENRGTKFKETSSFLTTHHDTTEKNAAQSSYAPY